MILHFINRARNRAQKQLKITDTKNMFRYDVGRATRHGIRKHDLRMPN